MEEAILIDEELRTIARTRHQLHAREAVLLVRAEELEIWCLFGCATFYEYLGASSTRRHASSRASRRPRPRSSGCARWKG